VKFFGKGRDKTALFLLFPDGREVKSAEDLDELRKLSQFSPLKMESWTLATVDFDAFSHAASKLAMLGIPGNETIVAFGPILVRDFPDDGDEYVADAVLTINRLVIYYNLRSFLRPQFLIVELSKASGLTSLGPWSAKFNFRDGLEIDHKGRAFEIKETYFEIAERFGRDGHANRRSVSLIDSFAKTLNELHRK
jgi:hypothetical protein